VLRHAHEEDTQVEGVRCRLKAVDQQDQDKTADPQEQNQPGYQHRLKRSRLSPGPSGARGPDAIHSARRAPRGAIRRSARHLVRRARFEGRGEGC